MRDDKSIIDSLMQSAIDFTSEALKDISTQAEYLVAGQENLLSNEVYDQTSSSIYNICISTFHFK